MNKCEHWWYKEQANGFCEKEAWHKNTAIAVPIVIVVLARVTVAVVFIIKKKASGREGRGLDEAGQDLRQGLSESSARQESHFATKAA